MKRSFLAVLFFLLYLSLAKAGVPGYSITGPDKTVQVTLSVGSGGTCYYSVTRNKKSVLEKSKLGLIREDADFSRGLSVVSASAPVSVSDRYVLRGGKRKVNSYQAVRRTFHLRNREGKKLDIIFQVSNDGFAFRYHFPERSSELKKITKEETSFNFTEGAQGWLQPMSEAKTGWESSNPSYEEYYQKGVKAGSPSPIKAGWVFPALFRRGENWALITESFPEGGYCATHLAANSPGGEYSIALADPREVFPGGAATPQSTLPWSSPWRIVAVGSLRTIVESTLGTDLATPAIATDAAFVKPGKSAWSWVLYKDDSTVYKVQKRFIDYASDMKWEYCLIDADWDEKIGYDQVRELASYAKTKNVGLILWYNSAGSWNTTPYSPRNKLITREERVKEFKLLQEMGIKGIKVDFFGGDGQSMIQYYHEILKDAASYHLMVNCHGATLPRGLHRTYPNLVTMEAIKGLEFATFDQKNEDEQPAHCATIPFTRNVFDPMDYTPMVLYKIPRIKRSTTNGFELALPVLFQSGVQHLAETPEGMNTVPEFVKNFLQQLPSAWDDVRFIDGFPGRFVVMARRSGSRWLIAGINGEDSTKSLKVDLSFLKGKTGKMITDGTEELSLKESSLSASGNVSVSMKPHGGFVMVY
ncbi:glycoside hydrolase family 97 catalytic domain-containing protein [Arcticibacter sp. MXS-1]|uniref:glycoside hydrolase family 97 protein n=1 Tax=Arcticibacter sp. MXS-1 TaxID=3341726 RepID=UPI0035A94DC4